MFDIGWTELLVIGVVALIVVGPKDLPKMFKTLGQMTAKARNMAREFQRAMEDAADASGVKDVARDLRGMTDPQGMGLDELKKFKNWDPLKPDASAPKKADTPAAAEDDIDAISAEMDKLRRAKAPAVEPAPAAAPATPAAAEAAPAKPQAAAKSATNSTPDPDASGPKA
jgi:sec-independent protein translocase protein TatB